MAQAYAGGKFDEFIEPAVVDVDDYLDAGSPTGQLRILAQTVATGDAPAFDAVETLIWTFDLTLDIGSRQYRAG